MVFSVSVTHCRVKTLRACVLLTYCSFLCLLLFIFIFSIPAFGHEMRPAYLELREEKPGEFSVLWKTPMLGEARLALVPEFSGDAKVVTPVTTRTIPGAAIQQWMLRAPALRGQTLRIRGLEGTMTDTLVRIEFAGSASWMQRLTPHQPSAKIPDRESSLAMAGVYLKLGVEHILTGVDHLLFVLALLIITRGGWKLMKTVTAFTIAHSITLAAATLGFVHVPQRPIEAVIALSIVFVAAEIVHGLQGREGVTARAPWIVAFTFGLLHGFGFAGALGEVGLPQGHIPLALLFFNAGVEAGQLLFVAVVLSLIALAQRMKLSAPRWAQLVPPYAIGSVAMFWVIQRIAAF
ncbi:MAG: HupE/UreJ family protein [Candidatus Brocadiaceae bacterium]